MRKIHRILFASALPLVLIGCSARLQNSIGEQIQNACGTFDLDQLEADLKSDTFERGGVELSKAVIAKLKQQIECERAKGKATTQPQRSQSPQRKTYL